MLGVDQKKVVSVFLKGDYGVLSDRMDNRTGHYMNPNLLKSQLNTLEMPIDGITVNTDQSPEEIVNEIIKLLKAI